MAVRVTDEFGSRANPPDSAYPDGSLKNETNPGVSDDGSPLDSRVGNDWEGFKQSLLAEGSITANGNPDSVDNPQILEAMKKVQESHASTYVNIVYKSSGGNSAFDNMLSGSPSVASIGDYTECENGSRFKRVASNGNESDFKPVSSVNAGDFGDDVASWQSADNFASSNGVSITFTGVIDVTSPLTINSKVKDSQSQLFTSSSQITIANNFVRPEWWGDIEESVIKAINALPSSGGVVRLGKKRYKKNNTDRTVNFVGKKNVTIEGSCIPRISSDAKALECGSIIEGRFNVFADGLTLKNVGFDFGEDVRANYYPSYDTESANHPDGGDWTALAFGTSDSVTPARARKNVHLENVIGLCSRPLTAGHAILLEGIDGLTYDNVTGIYSLHAFVVKAENVTAGSSRGFAASEDCFLIKSNTFAKSGKIQIASITTGKDIPLISSPWTPSVDSTYGLFIQPDDNDIEDVQIGLLRTNGAQRGYLVRGGAAQTAKDIQISSVNIKNATSQAVGADTCEFYDLQITNLIADTIGVGLAYNLTNSTFASWQGIKIDSAQLINVANWGVQAQGFATVKIDTLNIKSSGFAYYNETNARILIGKEKFSGVNQKWYTSGLEPGPSLSPSYSSASGYRTHEVRLENYGVVIDGTFAYLGGGTPTENATLITIPSYLRSPFTMLLDGTTKDGTSYLANGLGLTAGGSVTYNEGNSTPPSGAVVTCNISWNHF